MEFLRNFIFIFKPKDDHFLNNSLRFYHWREHEWLHFCLHQNQSPQTFHKTAVPKNCAIMLAKHLCWSLRACNFVKEWLQHRSFRLNIAKLSRTPPRTSASVSIIALMKQTLFYCLGELKGFLLNRNFPDTQLTIKTYIP